jgi:hypothetical protein
MGSVWQEIVDLLILLLKKLKKRARRIAVYEDGKEVTMGAPLVNTMIRNLTLVPKDASNNPAAIQAGSMAGSSSDPGLAVTATDTAAVLTPATDFVSAATVTVTFTALNLHGDSITGVYSVDVVAPAAPLATHIDVIEAGDSPKP